MTTIIQWCEMCSKAPADGMMEFVTSIADEEPEQIMLCEGCKDWIYEQQVTN